MLDGMLRLYLLVIKKSNLTAKKKCSASCYVKHFSDVT